MPEQADCNVVLFADTEDTESMVLEAARSKKDRD